MRSTPSWPRGGDEIGKILDEFGVPRLADDRAGRQGDREG